MHQEVISTQVVVKDIQVDEIGRANVERREREQDELGKTNMEMTFKTQKREKTREEES